MNHRELLISLYEHLRTQDKFRVWGEIPLGSVYLSPYGRGTPRADVLTMAASFTNPRITIYEVKASRADFQHDVHDGKYLKYFDHCNRLYFAAPSGLIKRTEVPDKVGLIVLGKTGSWSVTKGATTEAGEPNTELLIKLAIQPCGVPHYKPRKPTRRQRIARRYLTEEDALKRLGDALCERMGELESALRDKERRASDLEEIAKLAAQLIDKPKLAISGWKLRKALKQACLQQAAVRNPEILDALRDVLAYTLDVFTGGYHADDAALRATERLLESLKSLSNNEKPTTND